MFIPLLLRLVLCGDIDLSPEERDESVLITIGSSLIDVAVGLVYFVLTSGASSDFSEELGVVWTLLIASKDFDDILSCSTVCVETLVKLEFSDISETAVEPEVTDMLDNVLNSASATYFKDALDSAETIPLVVVDMNDITGCCITEADFPNSSVLLDVISLLEDAGLLDRLLAVLNSGSSTDLNDVLEAVRTMLIASKDVEEISVSVEIEECWVNISEVTKIVKLLEAS